MYPIEYNETHNTRTDNPSRKKAERLSIVILIDTKGIVDFNISKTIFSLPKKMWTREAINPNTDAIIHIVFETILHNLCHLIKISEAKAADK